MVQAIGPQSPGTRGPGAVSDKVASGGVFTPIIAILPRQLQSALVTQLAGQTTAARLLSLSAGGLAQIEVRGTPLEVQLKNLPAGQNPGDTVLVNFRTDEPGDDPGALTIRGGSVDRSAANRNTEALRTDSQLSALPGNTVGGASSAQQLSDAGRLLGALSQLEAASDRPFIIAVNSAAADLPEGSPSTTAGALATATAGSSRFSESGTDAMRSTSLSSTETGMTVDANIAQYTARMMQDMMKAIESSGLFYEAHLAQWNEGQRSEEDLRNEPQATWTDEDALGDGKMPDGAQPRESAKLVAAQLGQLDRPVMHMTLPGFFNDRVDLSIEPEQSRNRDPKKPAAWFATLKMDLPQLGHLEMRVTLMQGQCNVNVRTDAEHRGLIAAGFPELMDAMSAAGLKLTAQASAGDKADDPA